MSRARRQSGRVLSRSHTYQAISHVGFQGRAKDGLEPPWPMANQKRDEAPAPSRKQGAETGLEQERNKKSKTGPGVRPEKRRAEDDIEREGAKKLKRTRAPAKPKVSAGRKKQTAKAGPSSRQPARARAKRPVVGTGRVLRSHTAANKNRK